MICLLIPTLNCTRNPSNAFGSNATRRIAQDPRGSATLRISIPFLSQTTLLCENKMHCVPALLSHTRIYCTRP